MTEPIPDGPTSTFLDSLGARGVRRAEPRASIAIAGAGCALAVLGVLIVAGDTGSGGDEFNRVPGILLSALVVAAGFFTLTTVRTGPLATAGTVAAGLGVPPLMFFLTFDEGGFPPYSTEGILIVSTLVWLAAYVVGPGRGRPFFLGAGLIGAWFTLLQLVEEVFDAPFSLIGGFSEPIDQSFEDELGGSISGPSFDAPDPTTLALLSLGLGVVYLLVTRRLDRQGRHGVATPFALATLPTLYVGTVLLADDLEQAGTGLLLMLVGGILAYQGSTVGRRATAWIGGATTAIGAAVFLGDMTDDATIGGMLFLAAGIGLVAVGHAIAVALHEPDEMEITMLGDPARVGRRPVVAAPYAAGWAPPPDADAPVAPGHWNPPGDADTTSSSFPPPPPPPPPPPAAPVPPPPGAEAPIPPPPGAEDRPSEEPTEEPAPEDRPAGPPFGDRSDAAPDDRSDAAPDDTDWAPPSDPEDPTSPPAPPT